jgi:hypothetical protein
MIPDDARSLKNLTENHKFLQLAPGEGTPAGGMFARQSFDPAIFRA